MIPAAENNCHTVASAIATIGGALFSLHDNDDVDARMREFLAVSCEGKKFLGY